MRQKLHAAQDVQILVNTVMPWAEECLRQDGRIPAAAAWLASGEAGQADPAPQLRPMDEDSENRPLQEQEALLARQLHAQWQRGELAAAALVAPVIYSRAGSGERALAVRLHIETRDGYCADILMPYRIRAGWRWRGTPRNRVHFSHPVAQQSDPQFGGLPMPAGE